LKELAFVLFVLTQKGTAKKSRTKDAPYALPNTRPPFVRANALELLNINTASVNEHENWRFAPTGKCVRIYETV
jgi:hypothetical protein